MSNRDKRFEELATLLGAIDDGVATPEQCARLNDLLRGDPEACEFYLDYMAMSANLELEFGASKPIGLEEEDKPENVLARTTQMILQRYPRVATTMWNHKGWMSAAAVAMLSASVAGWMLMGRSSDRARPANPALASVATDDGVAVLIRTLDAEFGGQSEGIASGDILKPGEIRLDHGVAQIEFYSGARVMLEEGAVFELMADNEGYLKKGRLRAQVPPQSGKFVLVTPRMDLNARGAELGAFISDGGVARVHNFEGRVTLVDFDDVGRREIKPGTGLQAAMNGDLEEIAADQRSFLSWVDIVESSRTNARWRYRAWRSHLGELSTDPRVIVYYTFEDQKPSDRTLDDQTANGDVHHGVISHARWDEGRWSGKGALKFSRSTDRVLFQLDHDEESVTWFSWVRIDRLEPHVNGLIQGEGAEPGTPHWYLTRNGELELSISRGKEEPVRYTSKTIYEKNTRRAKWKQLATVYHAEAGDVIHYADGKEVGRLPVNDETALHLKAMQIGNWARPDGVKDRTPRNLNGAIDEVIIFNQALGVREIESLYEAGKPEA